MGAFTVALVLTDMWVWRSNRVVKHAFLGGIVTLLFFTLCQRGYEMVNWSLLGLFVLFLVAPIFFSSGGHHYRRDFSEKYDLCDTCDTDTWRFPSMFSSSCDTSNSNSNSNHYRQDPSDATYRWYYALHGI